jgi:hypothetical protein
MKSIAYVLLAFALSATPALAVQSTSNPLHVKSCSAALNVSTGYAGYSPGFYPYAGRPYYWNDVYARPYYQSAYTTTNPQVAVNYSNATSNVMSEIQFGLVVNGHVVAEFRDVGTFSPGADIKHEFGIPGAIFPLQGQPRCVPLHIAYANGTKWRNPYLPPPGNGLYIAPPH